MHQLFVDHLPALGQVLRLEGDERHYLGRVLRARNGEVLRLAAADGHAATAVLEGFEGDVALLRVGENAPDPALPFDVRLDICPPKGDALDQALEMAVQLGVQQIRLVRSERTLANLEGGSLSAERLQRRIRESARQCERARLPLLQPWQPLAAVLADSEAGLVRLFMSERGGLPLKQLLPPQGSKVRILIGPEGGFSSAEAAQIQAAGWSAVSLGPTILKVATAVAATLAGLQALSPLHPGD
jgi:16S rRNA (uracil1498-N3)-methyltransferase